MACPVLSLLFQDGFLNGLLAVVGRAWWVACLVLIAGLVPFAVRFTRELHGGWRTWNDLPGLPEAGRGWTFAGFIPGGLFWLPYRRWVWLAGGLVPCALVAMAQWGAAVVTFAVYFVATGLAGRRLAWESCRQTGTANYAAEMRRANTWGIISLVATYLAVLEAAYRLQPLLD